MDTMTNSEETAEPKQAVYAGQQMGNPNRNLKIVKGRGIQARFTLADVDNEIGRRVTFSLGTTDIHLARYGRNLMEKTLRHVGRLRTR